MGKTKDLGHLASIATYDASNNVTLPANLKINGSADVATQAYVGTQLGSYTPSTRSITINGTTYDLSADRSWTITSMIYPASGIALSTGSAWGTSITNNSANWNTAYGWGNHASAGYATTSSLSSYLPLSGGTLTGALNGTSATFIVNQNSTVTNSFQNTNTVNTNSRNILNVIAGNVTLQLQAINGDNVYIAPTTAINTYLGYGNSLNLSSTGAAYFTSNVNLQGTQQLILGYDQAGGATINYASNGNLNITPRAGYSSIFTAGNVGIGTTSPLDNFVVSNAGANTLHFDVTYSGGASTIYSYNRSTSVYTNLQLQGLNTIFKQGSSEAMRITSGGNVGIGTSSPNALLQVNGTSIIGSGTISNGTTFGGGNQINRLKIETGAYTCLEINGATSGGSIQFTYGSNAPNQVGGLIGYNYASGAANEFVISNVLNGAIIFAANNTEKLRITASGVIYNSNAPANDWANVIYGNSTSSQSYGLRIQAGTNSSDISFKVMKYDTSTTFYVRGDGYIFAPSTYYFTTGGGANMHIASDGSLNRSVSSIKYKKNVKDYDKGLSDVMKLRPVSYNSINENETHTYAGLIAEEVDELGLSEFVQYAEDGTPDALSYSNMVALLIKGMQELKAEVDELKNK